MKDKNIGFIGLGNVGSKLANSLLISGYNLFIHDLEKKKGRKLLKNGATWKKEIKSLSEDCSVIITCLPSPKAVLEVIVGNHGLVQYIDKKHLWIEMSTTDENEMKKLAKIIELKGAEVLESPVTGGAHKSETGNIAIFAAGKRKSFARAFPILSEIGYEILYCGKIGNASTLKIATNYLASIHLLSLGEALMVCKKYGLDLKTAYQGIKISSGNSFVHETESKVILSGSYDVKFTMDLVCKDLSLFNQLTKKYNIPSKISPLLLKIFNEGKKKFGDREWSTKIVKLLEDECNTDLRSKGFPLELKDDEPRKKGIEIKF
ncbi:MAG: 2-(hydroxymethyl)glutarate dehydrogenase [Alphaproteobacteria bacterium MarineAlpha6_Bin1]|nr:MAG: 2-(hydroxymethyl)glutarate dehydrogenase [Alphaproteobacteria bacterium MarineAlpha6_Bin1]